MSNPFKKLLSKKVYNKVWGEADDVILTNRYYGELYDNVPDDLKSIPIEVMEIHIYPEKYRKRLVAHQNDEPLINSLDFIVE